METTDEVLKLVKSNVFKELHSLKANTIFVIWEVSKLLKSNEIKDLHP